MTLLRVLSLNIWNTQGPWQARFERIRAGLRALTPDVVGLQEVVHWGERSQADILAEGLGLHAAFGIATDLGGGVRFGNAVLSRWPVASADVAPLPVGPGEEPRSLLCAELDAPFGKLPFFVTHLSWRFHEGASREAQALEIATQIKARCPIDGVPPVLVGDLNAQPESSEVRFLKGLHAIGGRSFYLADCFEQAGEGPGHTFDPTRNPHAGRTHEYPRRIDYVLVRGPDRRGRGKPVTARVVLDGVEGGLAASDHYGVLAEIAF